MSGALGAPYRCGSMRIRAPAACSQAFFSQRCTTTAAFNPQRAAAIDRAQLQEPVPGRTRSHHFTSLHITPRHVTPMLPARPQVHTWDGCKLSVRGEPAVA